MANAQIDSKALRQAELASEERRILGLLAVFALLVPLLTVRALVFGVAEEIADLPLGLATLGMFIAYELGMLRVVRRAIASGEDVARWVWTQSIIVEAAMPTLAILQLTEGPFVGPYAALLSPSLSAYFIFICLSTLRLSGRQSRLMGIASAVGYFAVVVYTWAVFPEHPAASQHPVEMIATHGAFILIAGFVAGAVADQIRGHVAAALREARSVERMEHDLELARTIQQGLLPESPPVVEGFEVAGWNQPADQTGGDYYDWQELEGGRVAITLADVTGHGIGPALVAAVSRAYGRANFPPGDDLSRAMRRINEQLGADLPRGKLVQLVAALLEAGNPTLQLLSAGHGPLLVFRATSGQFERLNAHGVPFGVMGSFPYGSGDAVHLEPGDMLILITDGFFEWERADGEQFGLDALEAAIAAAAGLAPREVIGRMYDAVSGFADGEPPQDDLTAVIVKRVADA